MKLSPCLCYFAGRIINSSKKMFNKQRKKKTKKLKIIK